jgi:hypothetical protein
MLFKFWLRGLEHYNLAILPMIKNLNITKDMGNPLVDAHLHRSMVRKLNFLLQSRPDIGFMVNNVSRFCMHPQKFHLNVVKHIYKYVKNSTDMDLFYQQGEDCVLFRFLNVEWGDRDDKRSTTSYTFLLGLTPITWHSDKQLCVIVSSMKNKYMALSNCAREGVWLWKGMLFHEQVNINNEQWV